MGLYPPLVASWNKLRETFLEDGTYLVNDILKEDREGQCRILQLI